jgi:hypothetical protein
MIDIDIQKLKLETKKAIAEAIEMKNKGIIPIQAEFTRKAQEDQIKAEGIIAKIPSLCFKAAQDKQTSVCVMPLKRADYHHDTNGNTLNYSQLKKGVAAIVWNACVLAGLKPSLEFWHDGCGMDSGFNMCVNWEE